METNSGKYIFFGGDGVYSAMFCGFAACPSCGHIMRVYIVQYGEDMPPVRAWNCRHCGDTSAQAEQRGTV